MADRTNYRATARFLRAATQVIDELGDLSDLGMLTEDKRNQLYGELAYWLKRAAIRTGGEFVKGEDPARPAAHVLKLVEAGE